MRALWAGWGTRLILRARASRARVWPVGHEKLVRASGPQLLMYGPKDARVWPVEMKPPMCSFASPPPPPPSLPSFPFLHTTPSLSQCENEVPLCPS